MSILQTLTKIFPLIGKLNTTEKFSSFELSYQTNLELINLENLTSFVSLLPTEDFIKISVSIFTEPITFTNELRNYSEFIDKLNIEKKSIEDEKITFKLSIVKKEQSVVKSIYDFDAFCIFWKTLSLDKILEHLSKFLKKSPTIQFHLIFNPEIEFHTENIFFSNETYIITEKKTVIDINKIRNNCHFENFENFPFTSNHFRLVQKSINENPIVNSLETLSFLFCITGIFDISAINGNCFYSKINGYKTLEFSNNISLIDISSITVYQQIYDWIYSEKSHVTDKIGLARNILSIYLMDNSYLISENVFTSIKSGYKTYLQQNINRYIEIRNKIGDQVSNISQKANDLSERYLTNYQKSNFAFISFFISIFLLKVIGTSKFENLFNKDTTILFFAFIGISIIYFIFSLITFNQDKKRIKANYANLKTRHEDLLDKVDINKILRNDQEFSDDMVFLRKRRNSYSLLWILTILIFVIVVLSLSTYFNWSNISSNCSSAWSYLFSPTKTVK